MKELPVECRDCGTVFKSKYVPDNAEPESTVSGVRCSDCGYYGPMTVKRDTEIDA